MAVENGDLQPGETDVTLPTPQGLPSSLECQILSAWRQQIALLLSRSGLQ